MIYIESGKPVKEMMATIQRIVFWRAEMNRRGWQPAPGGGMKKSANGWEAYMPLQTVRWYQEQGTYPGGI